MYFEEEGRDQMLRDNRRMLRKAMLDAGFSADVDEWWHYNWGNQMWAKDTGAPHAMYGEVTSDK
jgi:D-alanyl-D-alanine dipeptidase